MIGLTPATGTSPQRRVARTALQERGGKRLDAVDSGRGAVMVLTALDHTRTFLTNVPYNLSDIARTFPALFLTRWVSHFCTPFFLFLAGCGAYCAAARRPPRETARWLVTCGLVRWVSLSRRLLGQCPTKFQ